MMKMALLSAMAVSVTWGQANEPATARPGPLGWEAHIKALEAATSQESPAREVALTNLVKTGPEGLATDAMVQLIRRRAADIEPLALQLVPTFTDLNVRHLPAAGASSSDSHLKIARAHAVLTRAGDEVTPTGTERLVIAGRDTTGLAAMLLAESGERGDRDLVSRLLRREPNNSGLWLALAKMGFSDNGEILFAHSVMQDNKTGLWLRLSVATSLASRDAEARKIVTDALTSFLTTFGQKDLNALFIQMYNQKPNSPPLLGPAESRYGLEIISLLEFLQTPDAERLTFEFLDANNLMVRGALGLLAAKRWPDRLLGAAISHDEERVQFLAALSVLHPDLLPRVQGLVPAEKLGPLRAKLIDGGVQLAFTMSGNAGLLF